MYLQHKKIKVMKNIIFILSTIMVFSSCDSQELGGTAYNVSTSIEITVESENGVDLLNPDNPNSFREDSIKIYYLIDGIVEEIYNPDMDTPRKFNIHEPQEGSFGKYWMGLGLNVHISDSTEAGGAITYIKWNSMDTDTVKCTIKVGVNYVILDKVWYNDELVIPDASLERLIKIIPT